jgi:recombination protein RecA
MPDRLQQAITVLQTRFGSAAPRPATPSSPARSSGIPELDELTGIGGWPIGRLSLLAGVRGSGKRTLAQRSLAAATREGPAVYVDLPGRLDPEFLSRLGAQLDRLLIVRPKSVAEAMASVRVLARSGVDFIVIDLAKDSAARLDAELPHLLHRIAEAECTVLMVDTTSPAVSHLPGQGMVVETDAAIRYYASLILNLRRGTWVFGAGGDLHGVQIDATVVKNRLAPPGRRAGWVIPYPIP